MDYSEKAFPLSAEEPVFIDWNTINENKKFRNCEMYRACASYTRDFAPVDWQLGLPLINGVRFVGKANNCYVYLRCDIKQNDISELLALNDEEFVDRMIEMQ